MMIIIIIISIFIVYGFVLFFILSEVSELLDNYSHGSSKFFLTHSMMDTLSQLSELAKNDNVSKEIRRKAVRYKNFLRISIKIIVGVFIAFWLIVLLVPN